MTEQPMSVCGVCDDSTGACAFEHGCVCWYNRPCRVGNRQELANGTTRAVRAWGRDYEPRGDKSRARDHDQEADERFLEIANRVLVPMA